MVINWHQITTIVGGRRWWPSPCACCCTAPASAWPCGPWSTTATWPPSPAAAPTGSACSAGPSAPRWRRVAGVLLAPILQLERPRPHPARHQRLRRRHGRPPEEPAPHLRRRPGPRPGRVVRRRATCRTTASFSNLKPAIPTLFLFAVLLILPGAAPAGRRPGRVGRHPQPVAADVVARRRRPGGRRLVRHRPLRPGPAAPPRRGAGPRHRHALAGAPDRATPARSRCAR